ncbi:MAG: PPC domain-containing protein [Pseudomonadota bacterium]
MRSWLLITLGCIGIAACQCGQPPPPPPRTCALDTDCPAGQRCGAASTCEAFEGCRSDVECLPDERCRTVDGTCRLRPGFGRECEADPDCYPGFFCALGRCRDSNEAYVCANAVDCPVGYRCDRTHFYCIEEVPCTLSTAFPEVTCDPGQACDAVTQVCLLTGPAECTPQDQALTCGPDELCDASGRCVQCTVDAHCGPGLRCNARAGRCESEDLCRQASDCTPPLVCDPGVALCRVPLPPCDSDLDCAVYEFCNRVSGSCEPRAGACVDDRLEQNDSPAGAYEVTLPSGSLRLDQLQICPDDDDYVALALAAGDGLTAQVLDTSPGAETLIELFAPDGSTRLRSSFAQPRGNGTVSVTATIEGTYYVRVLSRTTPTPYELVLTRTPGSPCVADGQEGAAGNDVPGQAPVLAAGSYEGLTLCVGDVDHLALSLAAGEALRATVRGSSGLDPDLALLAADGEVLDRSEAAGPDELLFYRTPVARLVILRVRAFSGAPASYDLVLEVLPPLQCTPDGFEVGAGNNSAATATVVTASMLDQPLSLCLDDSDWFEVVLADFERLVAQARFEAGDMDLDLEVYRDPALPPLASSRTGPGFEAISVPAGGQATTLWLRVVAGDRGAAPYTLSLFTEVATQCQPDADEPNEVAAEAKVAPAAGQFGLCGFDEDLYAVPLLAGKRVVASIQFMPSEGDLDLQLLHPDGVTPLVTSDGVASEEHIEFVAQVDGTHYLRVYTLTSDPSARYLLTTQIDDGE